VSPRARAGVAAVVLVAALVGGGGALGYFRASGVGSGAITAADATGALTATPGVASADLHPGGSGEVALTVANSSPTPVRLAALVLDTSRGSGGFSVDAGHPGCTNADLTFESQDDGGAGWLVPARVGSTDGTLSLRLAGAIAMGAAADDACQGATFTVYLQAGP
jgi:hypothetical protein